ncbi:MAG: hypothetical protein KKF30_05710 [Proteobacteria bacterium]|nr:hypothetical protein [Pseudomonadota bacterium]MBU4472252.1 hypothetical protein [Pseudomonadota bacterium]MCG2751947.1 hypothetical protein [Desulfobacteraceae bacterium]
MMEQMNVMDNRGRRAGFDRRNFLYAACLPERRSGEERRCQTDRRTAMDVSLLTASMSDRRQNTASIRIAITS